MATRELPTCLRDVIRMARRLGWSIERRKDGYLLRHPEGGMTTIHHAPPSDRRAYRNIAADLRRTHRSR